MQSTLRQVSPEKTLLLQRAPAEQVAGYGVSRGGKGGAHHSLLLKIPGREQAATTPPSLPLLTDYK